MLFQLLYWNRLIDGDHRYDVWHFCVVAKKRSVGIVTVGQRDRIDLLPSEYFYNDSSSNRWLSFFLQKLLGNLDGC